MELSRLNTTAASMAARETLRVMGSRVISSWAMSLLPM